MKDIKTDALFLCLLILQLCGCAYKNPPPDNVYSDSYTASSIEQYKPLNSESGMTEREAVNSALANSPEYKTKQLKAVSAEAGYYSSLTNLTPNVSVNNKSKTTATYQANLSNVINAPAAKANADKAKYDTNNYRREMIRDINITYSNLRENKSIEAIQKENEEFQREMAAGNTKNKMPAADKLNFKIKELQAKAAAIEADRNYKIASYDLAAKMGITSVELPVNHDTEKNMPSKSIEEDTNKLQDLNYYLNLAIENRPDLKASKKTLEAAKYNLYSASGALAPTANAATGNFKPSLSVNENINPVSNIAEIRNKDADYAAQQEELQKKWISVIKEVREAYIDFQTQLAIRKNLENALQLAKQRRDITAQQYNNGKEDIAVFNQAQQNYVKAEKAYLDNRIEILKAKANLNAATGVQH